MQQMLLKALQKAKMPLPNGSVPDARTYSSLENEERANVEAHGAACVASVCARAREALVVQTSRLIRADSGVVDVAVEE